MSIRINESNFESEVINSTKPVLLDFYADWCGPCRMVAPIVEEIAEGRDDVKVCKINVDDSPALAIRYGVESIPTLIVIRNGEVANKVIGAVPRATIEAMFN